MGGDGLGRRIPVRTVRGAAVRTLLWSVLLIVGGGLAVAELAMDMTPGDRVMLYLVFGGMAVMTGLVALAAVRWAPRSRSLLTSLRFVAFAAVVVAGGVVALAALTMFIEPHDLTLVLVALGLGVGLGGVLAVAVAGPLTTDLDRLARTAKVVGDGDLMARTGISRRDELGTAADAFDMMTDRLASAVEAQRAADQERRTLIAAVGHDLRTPLASLQASVEALQDGIAADPDRYLRAMGTDIDHLRRLTDDLFLLARLDAGSHRLEPIAVDLAELVDEGAEAMTPLAAVHDVTLRVSVPGGIPVVADPAAVGRVLRNLIDNAIRHSPPRGVVAIALTRQGVQAVVDVSDEGHGFPPGFVERAFDRFSRADEARTRTGGGAGLGLAIARELVELSGGAIGIEPNSSTVRFSLPVTG